MKHSPGVASESLRRCPRRREIFCARPSLPRSGSLPGVVGPFAYRWRAPETLISVEDYRRAAARRVPRLVWDYIEGGADDLVTVRRNRTSFSRWSLRARMMTAHPARRLSTTVAGVELDLPVLLAPTGALGLSHWSGDLAAALAHRARHRYLRRAVFAVWLWRGAQLVP